MIRLIMRGYKNRCCIQKIIPIVPLVGATASDFGLPWDLLAEIDFLV